jgi:hypothetical protein
LHAHSHFDARKKEVWLPCPLAHSSHTHTHTCCQFKWGNNNKF